MNWNEKTTLVATCGRGCSAALKTELTALGYAPFDLAPTSVGVEGNMRDALRLNLWLRTANRVLFEVAAWEVDSTDDLYEAVRSLPWEDWLRPGSPFHVGGTARHPTLRDPRFALLRVKDAIADRFVETRGARPDSTSDFSDAACVTLHWVDGLASLYLDTSGTPLSHRGYRWRPWVAPLRETLAASILVAAEWSPERSEALAGPMCGSGTLAIEAAWMAQRRAPGLDREAYAFQHLADVDLSAWRGLKEEARAVFCAAPKAWISASDIDRRALDCARENAQRAGVDKWLRFSHGDFRKTPLPKPPALVVMNPAYGERMGGADDLADLYRAIGDDLKARCEGMRAAVFTGDVELGRNIALHPSKRIPMWNGDIECRLLLYEMYRGTRDTRLLRKHASAEPDATTPAATDATSPVAPTGEGEKA